MTHNRSKLSFGLTLPRNRGTRLGGFTLIELLVVVAIIGILSSVVLASLGNARKKGRDARRLSDLRQIASEIALIDGTSATAFVGCTAANAEVSSCGTPPLSKFNDPSVGSGACTIASGAPCDYAIGTKTAPALGQNATSQNWMVCAYLESKSGPLTTEGGLVSIDMNGTIIAGCTSP